MTFETEVNKLRTWEATFLIYSYFSFEKSLEIENVAIRDKDKKTFAKVTLDAPTMEDAGRNAKHHLSNTLYIIQLYIGDRFDFVLKEVRESTYGAAKRRASEYFPMQFSVSVPFPHDVEDQLLELHSFVNANKNTKTTKALKLYLRGVQIKDLTSEAFLKFYAVLEIIARQYFESAKEAKNRETAEAVEKWVDQLRTNLQEQPDYQDKTMILISKIYKSGFVEMEKQIRIAANDLGVSVPDRLGKIIDTRAKIAHGSSRVNVSPDLLAQCQQFAREMVIRSLETGSNLEVPASES